ncbi:DUF6134 family protein [Terasakiella sp. A23]|uniref:DUF6134 family protein n=1 Tax=Terasakiella sp. FCG-A23 TaxID=3080561 RepID=UPI0029559FE9|nr:DUF6134 family protein [Terasakiella sp. A23]MDV7341275.1 DUF6134 family protein [Terasakiella sp. A23]
MKYVVFVILALFYQISISWASNPVSIYGRSVEFDVLREGDVVGEHVTAFDMEDDVLMVRSKMNIDIFLLFIPVYGFDYRADEKWQDGRMVALNVNVVDGPDKFTLRADRENGDLVVHNKGQMLTVQGDIFSTNHWNMNVVEDSRVLNTLTGNLNEVTITPMGEEKVDVVGGTVMASRFDYSGDLKDTSVWYDDQGRWVKLQFKARDGSDIIYRCRTCLSGQKS